MNRYTSHIYTRYEQLDKEQLKLDALIASKDDINRPKVHISPKSGLLNDPNGLVYFKGKYHIFYQVCANGPFHGMKSWNLLTTTDFINYTDYGVVLTVTEEYENFGIFSGGATIIDNQIHLLYTGNYRDPENNYKREAYQVIAKLDDNYNVVSKRVIKQPDAKMHTEHFRDPVAIDSKTILIGAQDTDCKGQLGIITYPQENYMGEGKLKYIDNLWNLDSYMFECPNYFEIDGKSLMIFSPQGIEAVDKYTYQNIHDVVYSIADEFDVNTKKWNSFDVSQVDFGFDFYAPQVFNDGSRVLLIGWLGVPDTIYPGDVENKWSQMLTSVRELTIEDNILHQKLISEYTQLEGEWLDLDEVNQIDNKVFKVKFSASSQFKFELGNDKYNIILEKQGNEIILDRSSCQHVVNEQYGTKRYVMVEEASVDIEILVDMSCIEIFINNGKYTMSSRFFIDKINQLKINNCSNAKLTYLKDIEIKEPNE